jgi:hypothetical protein
VGEQFESRILKSFNPVTQELYRLLPAMIHPQQSTTQQESNEKSGWRQNPCVESTAARLEHPDADAAERTEDKHG